MGLVEEQQERSVSSLNNVSAETTTVRIPKVLAERISGRLAKTDFRSIDEYVSYVIEQVLAELENGDKSTRASDSDSAFTKEDQESVEQRLRDLGYL